jgi:hypothetical protein
VKTGFLGWLGNQTGRDDDIGRFAREATIDSGAPNRLSEEEWVDYLAARGAGPGARKAFLDAWDEHSRGHWQ